MHDVPDLVIETVAGARPRPGGARFGALVHAMLADVPLAAAEDDVIARLAEAHGRILGAEDEEVSAASGIVRETMRHPVLRAAAEAEEKGLCYRETPVTWRLDEGAIVEGNVDLAFVDGGGIVVVDFKTDRELDGALDRYTRQVQLYACAIAAAMGKPARAVLMRV